MFGFSISRTISVLFGFLYPLYQSYKALETPGPEDDEQWLTYWTIFSLLVSFEHIFEVFVSWIPFYWEIKIVFQIWLTFTANGGRVLYQLYIKDFFVQTENRLRDSINPNKTDLKQLHKEIEQSDVKKDVKSVYPSVNEQVNKDVKSVYPTVNEKVNKDVKSVYPTVNETTETKVENIYPK